MNDQTLFEMVRRADPLVAGVGEPPYELLERVLAAPRAQSKPRRVRGWHARLVLVAIVLSVSAVIASLAIAGTGWLIGSPAPANVQSDFGSYATQLGFNPQPGNAVLVASNGDYQLYATVNEQGGLCTLVSTPWNRPGPNGEGGDCTATPPDGKTVTAPVGAGGFFIVGMTVPGSMCDWGAWTPGFTVLDGNGQQLSTTTVTVFPGARKVSIPGRGYACVAVAHGPFGRSPGQLPLGR